MADNLHHIVRDCLSAGARVALVGYIQGFEENKILMRVASETGVPYVSTYLEPEARQRTLFTADGWHPSPIGHRHIAEKIAVAVDPLIAERIALRSDIQK